MKKALHWVIFMLLLTFVTACSSEGQSAPYSSQPSEASNDIETSSEYTEEASSIEAESVSFQLAPDLHLSPGMEKNEVMSLLSDSSLRYETEDNLAIGYDEMTKEVSSIIVYDEIGFYDDVEERAYYLGFSASGVLLDIIWAPEKEIDEEDLHKYISNEILNREETPEYLAFKNTDIFVFPAEGGFFIQTHYKLESEGGINGIVNRLSLENNTTSFPDERIMNKFYRFGNALVDGGKTGIGHEAAIDLVSEKYRETNTSGNQPIYSYSCFAFYDGAIYYCIERNELVDGQTVNVGQVLVSRDGSVFHVGAADIITDENP